VKVEKIDLIGFRGLRGESFTLDDLTVFEGEMGIGKTSKLLSILFCLTGSSPHGLNLDELINSNTDSMRVRALITLNGEIYSLERKKRRRMPASFSIKPEDVRLPPLDIGIFIEGRQIADLFMGGPTERALKLDTLLGISEYDQRVSQLTPAAAERRISELEKQRERVDRTTQSIERLKEVDDRLMVLHKRGEEVKLALSSMETEYLHAKALLADDEDSLKKDTILLGKKQMLQGALKQFDDIPKFRSNLAQELKEHEAKWNALQTRKTFLEAAMETLNIEGKQVNQLKLCPLCGALITDNALTKFEHYDRDYKDVSREIMEFKEAVEAKRNQLGKAQSDKERADLLSSQIDTIRAEIRSLEADISVIGNLDSARKTSQRYRELMKQKEEIDSTSRNLEDQKRTLESIRADLIDSGYADLEGKISRLRRLASDIRSVKLVMIDALNEIRKERITRLRDSFKETFKKIYPYERFTDVDFETSFSRGRESLLVRGKLGESWILASQMSTGENVAMSFALLFAINNMEKAPIILLDEPEEGLDDNGIRGLADTLNGLSEITQVVVATRSHLLAGFLGHINS